MFQTDVVFAELLSISLIGFIFDRMAAPKRRRHQNERSSFASFVAAA
jgi:hypothetical protein